MLGFTLTKKSSLWSQLLFWIWAGLSLLVLVLMLDSALSKKLSPSVWQRKDKHNCEMTYIYPNYYAVRTQPNSKFSDKYTMYLYREGHYDSEHLAGSPVLFIPGQAGSYKQVRSFASETSKYSFLKKNSVSMQDIDWFTLDLNEELTAFSGQQILDQATYTNAVIQAILALYKGKASSVVLVGHSMGGIVARTVMMQPNYTPHSVDTIFTFATPHQNAPILLDPILGRVYRDLSLYWQPSQFETGALQNLVLISVSGGSLDTIIHSDSTGLQGIVPESHGFDTFTTSIPSVWTGSDHMAILWCNQLAKVVARTLVDLVNLGSSSQPVQKRIDLIKQNLDQRTVLPENRKQLETYRNMQIMNLPITGNRLENNMEYPRLTMIPSSHFQFMTNLEEKYDALWQLGACNKDGSCKPLQPTVSLIPAQGQTYRLVSAVDSSTEYIGLLENSALTQSFIILHNDSLQYHMLTTWDILWTRSFIVNGYYSKHIFPYLRYSLFAYDLYVKKITPKSTLFDPIMQQTIHGRETKYFSSLKEGVSDRITFHQAPGKEGLALIFYTDDQNIELQISLDWYATLGRLALRYGGGLLQHWYTSALIITSSTLYTFVATGRVEYSSYKHIIVFCMKTAFLQVLLLMFMFNLLRYSFATHLSAVNFPFEMLYNTYDSVLTPVNLVLFILGVGLSVIVWSVITLVVTILSALFCLSRFSTNLPCLSSRAIRFSILPALSLFCILPASVLFVFYYVVWLLMTASSRFSTVKSDLPRFKNIYRYRQSWLLFLTSLLPYHVPGVIVFVKDLLVGWTKRQVAYEELVYQLPYVVFLVYLISFASTPRLSSRVVVPVVYICNIIIVNQALFGFLYPFGSLKN